MADIDYLLIGHVTADIVTGGRLLGGTVSYATPIIRAFGHSVGLLTSVSYAEPLLETLIPQATLLVKSAQHTTTFENIYQPQGRIQYVHQTADNLTHDLIPNGWLSTPLVHIAPLVDEVPTTIIDSFPNAFVMCTPQGYMRQWGGDRRVHFKRWLDEAFLKRLDLLVLSKQDIEAAPELEQSFASIAKRVVVTDGNKGGVYYLNGESYAYGAYPVEETDPTGAGDVFAASLLSSLPLLKHDIHAAIRVAARLAAISVTRKGADPEFSADDIQLALRDAQ